MTVLVAVVVVVIVDDDVVVMLADVVLVVPVVLVKPSFTKLELTFRELPGSAKSPRSLSRMQRYCCGELPSSKYSYTPRQSA